MPYLRRRQRVSATGLIGIRLSPEQRDLFTATSELPLSLRHSLHRAPVRSGKLTARVSRPSLDAMIVAAARIVAGDRATQKYLDALLRYLESKSDFFEEPGEDRSSDAMREGDESITREENLPNER